MLTYEEMRHIIEEEESDFETVFKDADYGYAVLQLDPKAEKSRDMHFMPYDIACQYAGRGPERSDYFMLAAADFDDNGACFEEITRANSRFDRYTALCDYIYETYNAPSRPNIESGYYGTSLSVSDVILIKERDEIKAFYVESFGFKELPDFAPYKYYEHEKSSRQTEHEKIERE